MGELCRQGDDLRHKGNNDAAIALYQKALDVFDNSPYAYVGLGSAFFRKGDTEASLRAYRKLLYPAADRKWASSSFEDEPAVLMEYALALQKARQYEEAYSVFQKGLHFARDTYGIPIRQVVSVLRTETPTAEFTAAAHLVMGNAYASHSHYEAALRSYREALRVRPNFGAAHYGLADVLLRMRQRTAEWRQAATKAIELGPPVISKMARDRFGGYFYLPDVPPATPSAPLPTPRR